MDTIPSPSPPEKLPPSLDDRERTKRQTHKSLLNLRQQTHEADPRTRAKEGFGGVLYVEGVPWQVLPRSESVTIRLTPEARRELESELARVKDLANDPDEDVKNHVAEVKRRLDGRIDLGRAYLVFQASDDNRLLVGETTGRPLGWLQRSEVYDWVARQVLTDDRRNITGFIVGESDDNLRVVRTAGERVQNIPKDDLEEQIRFAYRDTEVDEHWERATKVLSVLEATKVFSKPAQRRIVVDALRGDWLFSSQLRHAIDDFSKDGSRDNLVQELNAYIRMISHHVRVDRDMIVQDQAVEGNDKELH